MTEMARLSAEELAPLYDALRPHGATITLEEALDITIARARAQQIPSDALARQLRDAGITLSDAATRWLTEQYSA